MDNHAASVRTAPGAQAARGLGACAEPSRLTEAVVLHHLKSEGEIAGILHLREEIDLSAHRADANFAHLEKKETKSAWSSVSSWTESS